MVVQVTIHSGFETNKWKEKYIVQTKTKKIIYERNYKGEMKDVKHNKQR